MNTFYEDVKYMVSVGLYLLLFLSPIMYFSEQVYYANGIPEDQRGLVYFLYHLNPIAMLMTAYRKVMLDPQEVTMSRSGQVLDYPYLPLDWGMVGLCAAISIGMLIFGYWLFNRKKWQFVERP
jgi:ABC-2 type transport system permease protein